MGSGSSKRKKKQKDEDGESRDLDDEEDAPLSAFPTERRLRKWQVSNPVNPQSLGSALLLDAPKKRPHLRRRKELMEELKDPALKHVPEIRKSLLKKPIGILLELLLQGTTSELTRVYRIIRWLTMMEYTDITSTHRDAAAYYVGKMEEDKTALLRLFKLMCKDLDVPCDLVRGYAKGANYRHSLGEDLVGEPNHNWSLVCLGGDWFLVDLLWCKGGAETFLFMDPERFVYTHFPTDEECQLLYRPVLLHEYQLLAHCRQAFYAYGMRLKSQPKCVIMCHDGDTVIDLAYEQEWDLTGKMNMLRGRALMSTFKAVKLNRCVSREQHDKVLTFRIRFPTAGEYRFEIQARVIGSTAPYVTLCDYSIKCKTPLKNFLMFNSPELPWGPNRDSEEVMRAQSHPSAWVQSETGSAIFVFLVKEKLPLYCSLVEEVHPDVDYTDRVAESTQFDEEEERELTEGGRSWDEGVGKLSIEVSLPSSGQYILEVRLVTAEQIHKMIPSEEKFLIRYYIQSKQKGDPLSLQASDGSLGIQTIRKVLLEAMYKKRVSDLEAALAVLYKSRFRSRVVLEMQEGEKLLAKLKKMEGLLDDPKVIADRGGIGELRNYKNPPPIVMLVSRAVLLLLGETEDTTEVWKDNMRKLSNIGSDGLSKRVAALEGDIIPPPIAARVDEMLRQVDIDQVENVSVGAARFYAWAQAVIIPILRKHPTAEPASIKVQRDLLKTDPWNV